jgi:PAS domain S-box-containing protein
MRNLNKMTKAELLNEVRALGQRVADLEAERIEFKQAEQALRASEDKFSKAFHISPDSININRLKDGLYLEINEGFTQITGYTKEDVEGRTSLETNIWANSEDRARLVEELRSHGEVTNFEATFRMKDGKERVGLMSARIIEIDDQQCILSMTRDIAERKQVEAQLERNLRETRVRFEVSQALAGVETEDEVLDMLIQHAGLYPQALVAIFTFDRRGDELVAIVRRQNPFESSLTPVMSIGEGLPASSYTLFGHFFADYPFVSEDVWVDERFEPAGRKILRQTGVASFAAIPLTAGNEWMGYIAAMAKSTGYFDEEKQHLYQTLAEQGAVALHAARLRTAVRESQQRLSLLVQQSPLAVIEWNTEFQVVSWNPAAERIFGYTREETLGHHLVGLIVPEEMRAQTDHAWQAVLAQRGGIHSTNENLTKDGRSITCEWFNAPLVSANGQVIGVASLVQDITERKRAEEALREKTEELDRFFTVALDLLCIADTDGNFRRLNPQWEAVLGYSLSELEGQRFLELVHPDDLANTLAAMGELGAQKTVLDFVNRYRCKDGSYRWIEWRSYPMENLIYAAARDITERKRMETALRESEERYRTFVEDLPIGVYRTTPGSQGKHLIANSYYLRMFGYDSLEVLVKKANVSDMYVDPAERKSFSDNLLANRHVDRTELHLKRSDGTPVWGAVTASVAYDKGGEPYFDCAIEDITERKQTEEALRLTRFTVDSVADAVYWIDPQGQIVDVNETACRMLGYTYEELTAMSLTGIDPDFSLAQWPNTWKNIKEAGKLTLEAQHRTKVGRLVPVEVMANYINFGGRELDCAVVRDITERKRAEEEITSLARFPKENPSPVLRLDADGMVLFANPASEPILESWGCAAGQRVPEQWCKVTKEVLTNHISRTLDVDCNGRVFSLVAAPIASMNYVNLYAQDITERKKAEEILQMFQYSNDQASVAIFWMNRDAEYLYVNDEACRSLGYTREELLSLCLWDIDPYYPKELWDSNWEQYQEDRQGGGEHIETFHRRKDGVTFPVEVFSRHLWLGENEFHVAFVQDTTERKQVEAELRTSEARYRALVESQVDLISRYRPDTKLTFVNDAYCQFYGKTREELIGNSFLSMVAPEFHEQALKETENFVKDPRPVGGEYLNYRWDGQECWIHWVIQGIEDENGRVLELQATGRDVTPLKQAEEKIRQLNDELEQRVVERTAQLEAANKELEAFSYSVSHDLRAPLRAIDGFSRILIEDHASRLPDEVVRLLGIVRDNTQQMGRLIDDLLAFSRLSRQPVNMRTVDTADLVRQVLETLQNDLEGREVVIEVGDLPACQGDPTLLKQVWMNLLSNALKFTRVQESPRIEIGCEEKDGEKIYFVKDNGVGFDMRYVDKLFGVFQRLHRSDEFEGTGVGLAIVQRILHRHGGRVWTEAEPNVGATFFFTI